jgi:hypothetical protein
MVAFEPGRDIDQLGKALGVAFGKAVTAEPFDLVVTTLREIAGIAAAHHPLDHLRFIAVDRAEVAEGGHGPAKAIGFVGGEAGGDDRDLHRLFLEQRHAEGPAEYFLQLVRRMRRPG